MWDISLETLYIEKSIKSGNYSKSFAFCPNSFTKIYKNKKKCLFKIKKTKALDTTPYFTKEN